MSPSAVTVEPAPNTTLASASKVPPSASIPLATGYSARLASRSNALTLTSGLAPTYLQANLLILPSHHAADFRLLCARNPVPCPLLAESASPGDFTALKSYIPGIKDEDVARELDIRTDAPRYMVYHDGRLVKSHCKDVTLEWGEDSVAFLIGCSYSFESALSGQGLPPRHTVQGRNVPMYRTSIPLCPAGVFTGATCVVSMRVYRTSEVERVRDITRPYVATHGEPIAWGWDAVEDLGIKDIDQPDWGEAPLTLDGRRLGEVRWSQGRDEGEEEEIPVFWGCGVTPQEAVMRAGLRGTVVGHAPGHMVCLDLRDWDVVKKK